MLALHPLFAGQNLNKYWKQKVYHSLNQVQMTNVHYFFSLGQMTRGQFLDTHISLEKSHLIILSQ